MSSLTKDFQTSVGNFKENVPPTMIFRVEKGKKEGIWVVTVVID